MRRIVVMTVAILIAGLAACIDIDALAGAQDVRLGGNASNPGSDADRIELGRYLAGAANCAGCHTVRGGQPFAGGTAIPTSFGTFYGPNITPSRTQGIGSWSADDFWQALHNGKSPSKGFLYPAFPYTDYTRIKRSDSDAIYAYLMSLPSSGMTSKPHDLRFPYDQRALLGLWRALYFKPGVTAPDPARSESWNRGRYLVTGPGHCAACHTPRNNVGASILDKSLQGSVIAAQGWYATPLTGDAVQGLGRWSEDDIVAFLRSGVSRHGSAIGPMADVVRDSTQYLADQDLRAMAVYLKTLPMSHLPAKVTASTADAPSEATMRAGGKLYERYCAVCHQANGEGMPPAWPPLAGNLSVTAPVADNIVQIILKGGYAPETKQNPQPHGMPPFHTLSNEEVAALVTYIRNSWGNNASGLLPFEVGQKR